MKFTEELPEIYLDVDESDFSHLWLLAPPSVLELYLARAHSGDPTEIHFEIPVDVKLPSRGHADSCRYVMLRLVQIQSRNENHRIDGHNAKNRTEPDQSMTFSLGHNMTFWIDARVKRGVIEINCAKVIPNKTSDKMALISARGLSNVADQGHTGVRGCPKVKNWREPSDALFDFAFPWMVVSLRQELGVAEDVDLS